MSTIVKFKNMVFCEHLCVVSQVLSQFLASLHEPSGLFVWEQKLFQNVFSDLYSTSKITYVENGTWCVTTLSPHVQNLKTCPHNIGCEVGSRATHQKKCRRVLKNSSPKLQFWSWVLKTRRQNCSFGVEFWKLVTKTAVLELSFENSSSKLQFWWRVLKSFSIFVRTHCRVFPLSEHHF